MPKKLIITADIQNWNKIYEFITNYFKKSNLSQKNRFEIIVSSEEIFSNILHHSCTAINDEIVVSVDFEPIAKMASVVFKYGGIEFNPLKISLPDVSVSLSKRKMGGLGLLIVKNFTDDILYTYSDGRNILKISKKIIDF